MRSTQTSQPCIAAASGAGMWGSASVPWNGSLGITDSTVRAPALSAQLSSASTTAMSDAVSAVIRTVSLAVTAR